MGGLAVAGLLLAHGLVHVSFLSPRPPATAGGPTWPFDLRQSLLLRMLGLRAVPPRALGMALVAVTVGGYVLAALAQLGVGPASLWAPAVAIGSIASLALLAIYFHRWLVLGVAIDAILLYAVLIAGWTPAALP